jgi:ATP-binding cassette subfamily B (MDR/TAP) protein 1
MLAHGFKRSQYDSCVYIKFVNESPIYLLLYVDDMLIAAKSKKAITTLKAQLSSEFEMKDLGAAKKLLGMEITRDRKSGLLFLVSMITLIKFFIILICLMQRKSQHLLHSTSNCQLLNVLLLMKILSTCLEFHVVYF